MTITEIKKATLARIYELPLPFAVRETLENQEYGFIANPDGTVIRNSAADYGPSDYIDGCRLENLKLWELALLLEKQEESASTPM